MLKTSRRRVVAAIGTGIIAVAATLALGVAPAHAAPSGYLLMKGTGSVYSKADIVNLGVIPGGTAKTFYFKVVNTAPTAEHFKLNLHKFSPALSATLYKGYSAVPDEYVTEAIAPGRTLALKVKVTLPAGASQAEHVAELSLRNPQTNVLIDSSFVDANATYQTGTKRNDLFLKTGSQPYVGGSVNQIETANAIRVGNTATFSLRLKNDGATPAAIGLDDVPNGSCPSNFSITIKQGTQNVTAAVMAGSYNTGTLAPGAKKDLRVSIKLVSATGCLTAYFGFTASGPDGPVTQYAHVIIGV
jgi:hypothetical protein